MVATLFAIMAAGVTSSFLAGMRIWSKSTRPTQYEALLTFEMIARELRQAVVVDEIPFEGDALQFSFPTLSKTSVERVTYRFDPQAHALMRSSASQRDIIGKKELVFSEKQVLALDEVTLRYFVYDKLEERYNWQEECPQEVGKFSAVRIRAKSKGEELEKTVFIPVL